MEKAPLALFLVFGLLDAASAFPIDFSSLGTDESNPLWFSNYFLFGVAFLFSLVGILFGCICCRNGKGFKEFSNSSGSLAVVRPDSFVNPTANAELTIFPPVGACNSNQTCKFEPLPDIKPQVPNLRPAAFSYSEREISSQDWFSDSNSNFPRNQLKYVQEYGRGWFGRVVEGEAQNITAKDKLTKVMVKILHEDATPTDQMYFLHEVKFYRDLKHPNILRLLGRCLETQPFLVILECQPNGDLKTFLSQNLVSARALAEQGITLQMCSNITSGLQFMHENKFIHTDLAARNCLVGPDLKVKIGDYGNSIEIFKSDYYCAGTVALPVRWCAPETLNCTDVTIETKEVTPSANIWSLGVVFWEICEFCKLPYGELNDDQVIVRVLGEKNYFLEKPSMFCLYKNELYHLMKLCWNSPVQRPTALQIRVILDNLISSGKIAQKEFQIDLKRMSQDFEQRWQNLKPNYIAKRDNANDAEHLVNCNIIPSKLKNSKVIDSSLVESPLGLFMSNKNSGQESPRFCLKSEKENPKNKEELDSEDAIGEKCNNEKQDSFQVENVQVNNEILKNSNENKEKINFDYNIETNLPKTLNFNQKFKNVEAEVDSWLKGVEINNEEDEHFVRKVSEAIRDLDEALAMEKTSSSEDNSGKSSHQNSPGKDIKETNEAVVDFKLGSDTSSFINFTQKSFELSSLQNSEQPQSLNFTHGFSIDKKEENSEKNSLILPVIEDSRNVFGIKSDVFDESLKENDSLLCGQSRNSSDTDDEVWRKRIERGEISEKVKEKSKSIANLMILTHIDASDDSDIDLDKSFDKTINRNSFKRKSGSFAKSALTPNNFGSENNITYAVLEEDFKESLKKLANDHKEHGHFDSLGMILPTSVRREVVWENFFKNEESGADSSNSPPSQFNNQTDIFTNAEDLKEEKAVNSSPILVKRQQEENVENSNNFLGNVASEKTKDSDNKIEEKADENLNILSRKDEIRNEIEEINPNSNEANFECDKSTYDIFDDSASENISSHLCENSCKEENVLNNVNLSLEENDCNKKELSLSEDPKNLELESSTNLFESNTDVGEGFGKFAKFELNNQSFAGNKENILAESECQNEEKSESAICKGFEISIPEITISEAQDNAEFIEEVFEPPVSTKIRPFKFVLKDSSSIPEILITQEPDGVPQQNEEVFEFLIENKPQIKPFKFVLKEEEEEEEAREEFNKSSDNEKVVKNLKEKNEFNEEALLTEFCKRDDENLLSKENETVIIGACEDYTLDYFKGLKTTVESKNFEEKNDENFQNRFDYVDCKSENIDWNEHHKMVLTPQPFIDLGKVNFESDIFQSNESHSKDSGEETLSSTNSALESILNFITSEKVHTDKVEEPFQMSRLTSLNGNEEEYDNFKLRTPDDERSSDSGFRDKGSLSESVEDACEGKYNLEDIEAELEEAYVKGAFGNYDCEKDNNSSKNLKNFENNFEYEESKFYEEENKNDDNFSDIDGEIEFWNKDNSDYYPEISEFNPTCSQGWYLHPPDESNINYSRNVNEDIVNALRNELRENLPVQTRSFEDFKNDFFEPEMEDLKVDYSKQYLSDVSTPLSPITEEHEVCKETIKENTENSSFDKNQSNKVRKNIVNIMESVKSIDTNTFMQYLDYMVEKAGKDLDGIEEAEEDEEKRKMPVHTEQNSYKTNIDTDNFESNDLLSLKVDEYHNSSSSSNSINREVTTLKNNSCLSPSKDLQQDYDLKIKIMKDDVTNEANLLEHPHPESIHTEFEGPINVLEINVEDNSENDGLIFTPEMLTPDRERSLSEISRSSNGTRTGDALSEITLSSPDLVPDCFNSSVQELIQNNETDEVKDGEMERKKETENLKNEFSCGLPTVSADAAVETEKFLARESNYLMNGETTEYSTEEENPKNDVNDYHSQINNSILATSLEEADQHEMSTSFMGDDDDSSSDYPDKQKDLTQEPNFKSKKELPFYEMTPDWESQESSLAEEEEMSSSSSSGEFIWKEGETESKIKAIQVSNCEVNGFLFEKSQNDTKNQKSEIEKCDLEITKGEENKEDEEDDEDDKDSESSTGSSASVTDFVPSAWNSQAVPSRSVLKNPDKKSEQNGKKTVWFKKQKYHCIYEYPREPSDNEDGDDSVFNQLNFEKNSGETPTNKHFNFAVNTVELPNNQFPYGISNVIDYSSYSDWDILEGDDGDLSLTDTDSESGTAGKTNVNSKTETDFNFYNLSPFDYDFNSTGIPNEQSEFNVSSSSRPFQSKSSSQFFPGNNEATPGFKVTSNSKMIKSEDIENAETELSDSRDFVTPDSGLEDSEDISPSSKTNLISPQSIVLQMENIGGSKEEELKFNFGPEILEMNAKKFEDVKNSYRNGLTTPSSNSPSSPLLSPTGLGELRHARNKLKLDLPFNHNAELGAVINKKVNRIH